MSLATAGPFVSPYEVRGGFELEEVDFDEEVRRVLAAGGPPFGLPNRLVEAADPPTPGPVTVAAVVAGIAAALIPLAALGLRRRRRFAQAASP